MTFVKYIPNVLLPIATVIILTNMLDKYHKTVTRSEIACMGSKNDFII
jgi:hypothetical protein